MISKLPPHHAHHSFLLDRFDNGDIYTGEFYAGSFLKGEFSCAHSGDTHTGDWKNGLKHGQGHTVYGSKDEYEGWCIYIYYMAVFRISGPSFHAAPFGIPAVSRHFWGFTRSLRFPRSLFHGR